MTAENIKGKNETKTCFEITLTRQERKEETKMDRVHEHQRLDGASQGSTKVGM